MKSCDDCPFTYNAGTYEYPEPACHCPERCKRQDGDGCRLHRKEAEKLERLIDRITSFPKPTEFDFQLYKRYFEHLETKYGTKENAD